MNSPPTIHPDRRDGARAGGVDGHWWFGGRGSAAKRPTKAPRSIRALRLLSALCAALVLPACAELRGLELPGLSVVRPLDEPTVADGLKEALQVGAARAVAGTSTLDGFLGNELLRIAVPPELGRLAQALRTIGMGAEVDAFEVAMNRAAERAAGEAKDVFRDAVAAMTIADAFAILRGSDTAATEYLQQHTAVTLQARFAPIVRAKMETVGLYRSYQRVSDLYTALPLAKKPAFDLEGYVTHQTLAGLFTALGEEEREIRRNPAARSTALLRRVFAGADPS